jgi:hypothetical protein
MTQWKVKDAVAQSRISAGNSKMPGSTFSTDAFACKVGSKLAKIEGSVCSGCYARKLQKLRPSVDQGWQANYVKATTMIASNPERWADAVAFQIKRIADKSGELYHRWFDSGDLDSVDMLRAIVIACNKTPHIKHWLPTREARIVKEYRKQYGKEPSNLVIRVSATMIGDKPISGHTLTSTVHRKGETAFGHECPAPKQNNNCGDCRACWSNTVANVSYTKH